jgi:hypothetical protein
LHTAPRGDFNKFMENLDNALKHLYKPKAELFICGDITQIISLKEIEKNKTTSLIINKYNLSHTVNFVTRIQNNSSTATDNISVDNSRINLSSISPIINGL